MSTNKHIKNQQNDFDQLLRKKLEHHQPHVDPKIWDRLESNLPKQTQKPRIIPWYYIPGAVAAMIAMVLLIHPFDNTNHTMDTSTVNKMAHKSEGVQEVANIKQKQIKPQEKLLNKNTTQKKASKKIHYKKRNSKLLASKFSSKHSEKNVNTTNENSIVAKTINKELKTANEQQNKTAQETQNKQTNKQQKKEIDLPDLNDYPDYKPTTEKTRKKRKPILTAYAGSNTNLQTTEKFAPPMFADKSALPPRLLVNRALSKEYALSILNPEDYSEVQHMAPLSFGLHVELPVNKRLGIETGISYTYLKSYFSRSGPVNYSGTLRLHYLGIPLNLRGKVFTGSNWNIYTSIGGMVEKGLHSYYKQSVDGTFGVKHTDVSASIDGFQLSVNAGIGIDVALSKSVSLFAEPDVTYYLENNQPMSARTEQPLNFGINGGIRFEL